MKEMIEKKLDAHIKSILKKDAIDFADYQILTAYLAKLDAEEKAKKWEEEKNAHAEEMMNVFSAMLKN